MEPVGTPIEDAVRPGIGTSNTRTPLPLDSSSTFNTPDIGKLSPSQAPGHPSLTAQSSSQVTVNDFGDSKELSEHRPPNNAAEDDRKFDGVLEKCDDSGSPSAIDHDPPSRDEIVSHAGGHFPDSLSRHQALKEQDLRDRSANASHPDTIREPAVHEEALEEALRAALCNCPNSKDGFVPFDALNRLITKSHVLSELSTTLPGVGRKVIEEYSQAVLARKVIPPPGPTVIPTSSPTFTTRRKIFAILVLLGKVPAIVDFIREDLYDNILPLKIIDNHKQGRPFLYYRPVKDGDLRPLEFAIPWRAADREQFEQYQWRFLAPYFDVCNEKGKNKVHHYDLPDGTVLPFMKKDQYLRGGYSDVWRVIIHPAHHNHPQQNSPSFAMKRLRDGTDFKVFKAEASNLKRFNSQGFPHLIKLYLTFRLQGHYYLLFPWADGNLLQFMKTTFPDPRIPCRTRELAIWFMGECCGAAEALRMIHTFPTSEQPSVVSAPQAKHGYHGDLKPENILFFLDHEGREDLNGLKMAVLKIGDFGLMQWHNSSSVEKVQANAVSRTYRAPEWDIGKKVVSQSHDIWALGCVLLEFCAWYLGGWEEVDQFSQRRAGGDSGDNGWDDFIREDAFFDYAKLPTSGPDDPDICVRAKQAVYEEFASLLNLSNCTDFMTKMLIFIREHLLRINSRNRADCDYICTELKKIHQECIADAAFCTERLNVGTIRVGTDLSETYALNPSAVQKDHIQRQNPLLNHTGPVNAGNVEPLNHDSESPGPSRSSREARQSISFPEKEYNIVGKLMESKHDKGENITLVVEQSGAQLLSEDHVVSPDNQDQQPRDTTIENGNNRNSHLVASQPTSPCEAIAEDELEEGMQSQKQTGEIEPQVNQAPSNANCPNAASSLNVPQGAPSHHSGASVKSGKGSRGASSITATNRSQENGSFDPGPSPAPPGDSEGPQLKRSFRSFLRRLFCFSSEV